MPLMAVTNGAESSHSKEAMNLKIPKDKTLAIVMGGGAGTRLFPLTEKRAKPAVPLGAKYRLVDIPISNCINSGLRQVYVLTQFNSESLHRHIATTYKFDIFTRSFVEILAAQQTREGARWYQGTADAVRQNLHYLLERPYEHYLILSGDQLYRMDYGDLLQAHIQSGADVTLSTTLVDRQTASGFGILQSDAKRHIFRFEEKPKDCKLLGQLRLPPDLLNELGRPAGAELYQGSMGIYVFNRQVLIDALANDHSDFGKHIIPASLEKYKVFGYIFQGYWEDIGTVRAFFEANLALTDPVPAFNFFDHINPIYTRRRLLPASRVSGTQAQRAIIADGCMITDAHIDRAVIGIRCVIESGTTIRNSVLMGADFYQDEVPEPEPGTPRLGIGRGCHIEGAIIDKNARIGEGVVITPNGKPANADDQNYYVRDGVVVVPKSALIRAGSRI